MTAWLRAGYKDESGAIVTKDSLVTDNVVLTFKGDGFLTVRTKNLPNHPTALFPGFNPSYIQETNRTYRFPLEPVLNPQAIAMNDSDRNGALPMGPIGLAVNGVVFFNPFDANMRDASSIMDYCCGHPGPDNRYHYHKYPICVNTPFVDKGTAHSEVIGFAFDGLPDLRPLRSRWSHGEGFHGNPAQRLQRMLRSLARLALPRHSRKVPVHYRWLLWESGAQQLRALRRPRRTADARLSAAIVAIDEYDE